MMRRPSVTTSLKPGSAGAFLVLGTFWLAGCAPSAPVMQESRTPATQAAPPAAVVQPGAPGEPSKSFASADELDLQRPEHTPADTHFMQGMIHHHMQAIEMSALAPERTNRQDVLMLAHRIDVSQESEIRLMRDWLRTRGEQEHMHEMMMPGMLTAEQMDALRTARGAEFDRLFLTYMIQHHRGALIMVDELFAQPGAGQDQDIFRFASEVNSDQQIEILRMQQMLSAN
jgi:uncharacterized protein (DUF305 family)